MKNIGIWIDKREAKIVSLENGKEQLKTIASSLEELPTGTRSKGGSQEVERESKTLERERHQLNDFFKDVIKNIEDSDAIVIFGPAQTRTKLAQELSEKHSKIHSKIQANEKADNMTDNQIIAWVRDYFNQ